MEKIDKQKNLISHVCVILCALIMSTGIITMLSPVKATAETYYVDASSGNDNNSGTSTYYPWRTVAKVNGSAFQPGDQILFKRGQVWHEGMWIKSSGTEDEHIIVGAYGTSPNEPVLSGTYANPFYWEAVPDVANVMKAEMDSGSSDPGIVIYDNVPRPSIATIEFSSPVDFIKPGAMLIQTVGYYGNLWVTSVNAEENKVSGITYFRRPDWYWLANSEIQVRQVDENTGREVTSSITIADTGGLQVYPDSLTTPGQWYWNEEEKAVYLYVDEEVGTSEVEIGKLNVGFVAQYMKNDTIEIHTDYLTVQDLTFRGFRETGINFFRCKGIKVKNVTIYGVGANGHMTGILLNNAQNCIIEESRVEYALRNGISIYARSTEETDSSTNNIITNNDILNSGSSGISMATDFLQQQIYLHDNLISYNLIENSNLISYDAAGIYLLNTGEGNRIIANTIRNGGSAQLRSAGIMVDSGVLPTVIENNIIENNSLGGITVTGEHHIIKNNTVENNGVQSWESAQILFFTVIGNASGCTVEDNTIEAGADQALFMVLNGKPTTNDEPHVIDNNYYYTSNPAPFCWTNKYTCSDFIDYEPWQCVSGAPIDIHSFYNDIEPADPPPTCDDPVEPPDPPQTYYLSFSSGDNNNDGLSEATPWKDLYKITSPFTAGDKILLKRGDTWHYGITTPPFSSSGIPGYPITIGAYGDDSLPPPLIDGTYVNFPFNINWEPVEDKENIYHSTNWNNLHKKPGHILYENKPMPDIATLQFDSDVSGVKPGAVLLQTSGYYCNMWVTSVEPTARQVSGITFFKTPAYHWLSSAEVEVRQLSDNGEEEKFSLSLTEPGGLITTLNSLTQPGHWFWSPDEESIYLYSSEPPDYPTVEMSYYRIGFNLHSTKHVVIKDIDIRGFMENGVYTYECSNIDLKNLHIYGTGPDGFRSGVLFHNSSNCSITDSTVSDSLVSGIGVYSMSPGPAYDKYSWDNVISGNQVLNSGSAGISINTDHPSQADNVKNTTVSNNLVERANDLSYDSAGIYILNVGSGNRITGNTVRNGGSALLRSSGIMIDGVADTMVMESNTLENNSLSGISVTGNDHLISDNIIQFNSSPSGEGGQLIFFTAVGNASGCTVENNVIRSYEGEPLFMVLNGKPTTEDEPHIINNNTYNGQSVTSFCWNVGYTCEELIEFDAWQSAPPEGYTLDADSTMTLSLPNDCEPDGDVDGLDLVCFIENHFGLNLSQISANFGMIE